MDDYAMRFTHMLNGAHGHIQVKRYGHQDNLGGAQCFDIDALGEEYPDTKDEALNLFHVVTGITKGNRYVVERISPLGQTVETASFTPHDLIRRAPGFANLFTNDMVARHIPVDTYDI